jgi:hypothetical protein
VIADALGKSCSTWKHPFEESRCTSLTPGDLMSAALASLRQEGQVALRTSTDVSMNVLCPSFDRLKHYSADFR